MENIKDKVSMAIHFLTLTAAGKVDEAFETYVTANFIHHNQYFKGDRTSLMEAMKTNAIEMPNKQFEVKMLMKEEDKVMTYSHIQLKQDEVGIAVVHIIRFENEKIAEMWDLGQVIAKDSPNENGLF